MRAGRNTLRDIRLIPSKSLRRLFALAAPSIFALAIAQDSASTDLIPGHLIFSHGGLDDGTGAISMIDPNTGIVTPIASGGLLNHPPFTSQTLGHVAVSASGLIYVHQELDGAIIRIDPISGAQTPLATSSDRQRDTGGMDLAPDGLLYVKGFSDVPNNSILSTVDPITGDVSLFTIETFLGGAEGVAVSDTEAFVALRAADEIRSINLATKQVTTIFERTEIGAFADIESPFGLGLGSNGDLVFADNGWPALMRLAAQASTASILIAPEHTCDDDPERCGVYWGIDVADGNIAAVIRTRDLGFGIWVILGSDPERFLPLPGMEFVYGVAFVPDLDPPPLVFPLSPIGSPPEVLFEITANDGFSSATTNLRVEAQSGSATIEIEGVLNPIAAVTSMSVTFDTVSEELTIGTAQIPFTFFVDAFTETASDSSGGSLASFDLSIDGETSEPINLGLEFLRDPFVIQIDTGGALLTSTSSADCTVVNDCITGTLTATISDFSVDRLAVFGGTPPSSTQTFDMGTDPQGITWSVGMRSLYPFPSLADPVVFVPEPSGWVMLAAGLGLLTVLYRLRTRRYRSSSAVRRVD